MKRFLNKITILSIMTLLLISISSNSFAAKVKVSKIKLNKTEISLIANKTATIKATVSVSPNIASNKKVTFKSSNEKVAKVDSKGKVTAIKAGTATITVTSQKDSKVYAKCKVTVKSSYQGVELKYSGKYSVCKTPLTKKWV